MATRTEIMNAVAEKSGLSVEDVQKVIDAFEDTVKDRAKGEASEFKEGAIDAVDSFAEGFKKLLS